MSSRPAPESDVQQTPTDLELVHQVVKKVEDQPTSAKAHGIDSVKQRTDLATDIRAAMGAASRAGAGGRATYTKTFRLP
jgi:hypothetical protein